MVQWFMWAVYDKGKYGSGLCGQYMTEDSVVVANVGSI